MDTIIMWRPTGPEELTLIENANWKAFPPRLPEQPIFYPVTNKHYAERIAKEWNVPQSGSGYVVEWQMPASILDRWPVQIAGDRNCTELWVPAEELEAFNALIIGSIKLVKTFTA